MGSSDVVAPAEEARSEIPAAEETWTCEGPNWVLSRRRAVLAALSGCHWWYVENGNILEDLRLFLKGNGGALRAVFGFGCWGDREGGYLAAADINQVGST